jgi:hypothetical protein
LCRPGTDRTMAACCGKLAWCGCTNSDSTSRGCTQHSPIPTLASHALCR